MDQWTIQNQDDIHREEYIQTSAMIHEWAETRIHQDLAWIIQWTVHNNIQNTMYDIHEEERRTWARVSNHEWYW